MRTLSARILLGLIALTLTFGVFAATIVWNLREVEDEASLILRGYVPLAINSGALARVQEDLKSYLDQGIADTNRPSDIANTVTRLQKNRDQALEEIVKNLNTLGTLVTSDGQA